MKKAKQSVWVKALLFFLVLMVVSGVVYPLAVTGIAKLFFGDKSNGSMIEVDGKKYGSVLLGQEFTGNEYLWGRIMNVDTETYTNDKGEKLAYAAPSNLSPASEDYEKLVQERIDRIRKADPSVKDKKIPSDLVTCSGSGLDPHISVAAAKFQVSRIAKERGLSEEEIQRIVDRYTEGKFLGLLGEETVNVLQVNLALDGILK